MPTYRPRMHLDLIVPDEALAPGAVVTIPVDIRKARWVVNDHNHADELEVDAEFADVGIDPRMIQGSLANFYMGDAGALDNFEPSPSTLRFVGRLSTATRAGSEDGSGMRVELKFLDYTSFFLLAKPVAAKAIPKFSDTLSEAWARLCDGLGDPSPVADLAKGLLVRGSSVAQVTAALQTPIGHAVPDRLAKLGGPIAIDPKMDAWAIWQTCVGMMGLISYFERDRLVCVFPEAYYGPAGSAPRFVWGENIMSYSEERQNDFEKKGVALVSFDPLTGRTIEALWPPEGDKTIQKKQAGPGAKRPVTNEARDYFPIPNVSDPEALLEQAKRIYEERSRQEMVGQLTTVEMVVKSGDGTPVDLLALQLGTTLEIQIDPTDFAGADLTDGTQPSKTAISNRLVARGLPVDVAGILARNWGRLTTLRREWCLKGYEVDLSSSEEGGEFKITIHYCNRLDPTDNPAPPDVGSATTST